GAEAGDAREGRAAAGPMTDDPDPDRPAKDHPGKDPPYDLCLGDMQSTGKLCAVAEREQDAERQCGEPRDQCDAIQLIQPLERREELENLAEAAGLELAELQQVQRRG